MPRYKETNPTTEFYDVLQDACQIDLSRLDSQEIPLCSTALLSFLKDIGFSQAFKEIVVTGSIQKSISKRSLDGRFSPFTTPFDPVACIEYSGAIGTPGCAPILLVNPLIMRKDPRERQFILKHEILHYLQDHLHKLVLDEEEEADLRERIAWVPYHIVHLADELLREALVEDALLAIEGQMRPSTLVDDILLFYLTDSSMETILTARLGALSPLNQVLAKRYLNIETLYTLLSILGSYWISDKPIPPRARNALQKLPKDYFDLYTEFSQFIPRITKDAFIDEREFMRAISFLILHSEFCGDYLLYKAAGG